MHGEFMKAEHRTLIEKFLNSELDDTQLAELKLLIESDDEVRDEVSIGLEFKGMIECTKHDQYENLEDSVISQLKTPVLKLEDKVINELKRKPKKKRFPVWIFAAAAMFIIGGLFFLNKPSTSAPIEVALLKDFKGQFSIVRGEQKIMINEGERLQSGDLLNIEDFSHLTIQYDDGSSLIFHENSFAKISDINGKKNVELFSGKLQADIEKQPADKQMEFITKHSKSVILGTSFTLSTTKDATLLDVNEGVVRFSSQGKSLKVNSSNYAVAGGKEEFKVQKSSGLLYKSPLVSKQTPDRSIPIKVNIKGLKKIYLVVSNGGENSHDDHSAWLRPRLIGPNGSLDLTKTPWTLAKVGHRGKIKEEDLIHNGVNLHDAIYAHATSVFSWDVPEGYHTFEAEGILLDSSVLIEEDAPTVNFEIHSHIPEKELKRLLRKLLQY